jgi:hypothetical protein
MLKISNPFPMFFDLDRLPLADGKIYVGTAGADPEVSPIVAYWDAALTAPAAQPLRTIDGLIVNDTTPAAVYVAQDDFSMRVRDANDVELFYSAAVLPAGISYQPLDDDLTAIASQVNTAYGFALLRQEDAPTEGAGIDMTYDGSGRVTAVAVDQPGLKPYEFMTIAVTGEDVAVAAGAGKVKFRLPYAVTLAAPSGLAIRASLSTPQTSGALITVDINENGVSILSTALTIDNGESTSKTAATAAVITDANLAEDSEMSIDVDGIGDGTGKGLKITFVWRRT